MNHRISSLAYFVSLILFLGCQKAPLESKAEIEARCSKLTKLCDPGCLEKKFRVCYIDSELFPEGPYNLYKHCHAVHVGNTCAPCEQIFSLNFGGSMRPVSCQEFFETLNRKNASCNNCLKKLGRDPQA